MPLRTAEDEIDAKCSALRTEIKEKLANGTFAGGYIIHVLVKCNFSIS